MIQPFGIKTEVLDFSNCQLSGKLYGGSEYKIGIIYNASYYILKFPKVVGSVKTLNHISEYLGSQIYSLLGVPVHETLLGIYRGEEVVALKDFTNEYSLQEFNNVGESSLDSLNNAENHIYEYKEIESMILSNKKLVNKNSVINRFWKMFVIDALIGNFDRHGYNWGYLCDRSRNYHLAPVYDNGSCLFPRLLENDIPNILNNEKELKLRTYTFPTSRIKLNDKKSSYYDVISSGMFEQCDMAVNWLCENINFDAIEKTIANISFISNQRAEFYNKILRYRYEFILLERYNKITGGV